MGILRSEDMYLYKFAITKDYAPQIVDILGKVNSSHFIDMNKNQQVYRLQYTDMIKRCEESERRLLYIHKECERYKVKLRAPYNLGVLDDALITLSKKKRKALHMLFDEIETDVKEKELFIQQQNERIKTMHDVLNDLLEYKVVLEKADHIIHGQLQPLNFTLTDEESLHSVHHRSFGSDEPIRDVMQRQSIGSVIESSFREVSISYIAGTIDKEDVQRFKKLIFRTSRGKVLSHFEETELHMRDFQGNPIRKVIYVLIFQEGTHFRDRIQKICDAFLGKRYQLPQRGHGDKQAFKRKIRKIEEKITDTQKILKITKDQMKSYLSEIDSEADYSFSMFQIQMQYMKKEKLMYQILNCFQSNGNLYYGFMWSNLAKHQLLNKIYEQQRNYNGLSSQANLQLEEVPFSKLKPPTHFYINAFTYPFQEIVNTYGIPTYKEFNPAVFTCVTFPFLFGIMFGDVGHGSMLFLASALLCLFNSRILSKYPTFTAGKFRYLLLLMGFFAIYCGLIYNDMMAIPVALFDSCYDMKSGKMIDKDCVYPMGVDTVWAVSKNELNFMNSLKMKIAVILGVAQMSLGVILKAANAIHFKNYLDLIHEFIPQILLLVLVFGYMDFLIIVKWLTDYTGKESLAPSIITSMINIPLNGAKIQGQQFFGSMGTNKAISILFFVIGGLCVPWMLFAKPLILKRRNEKSHVRLRGSDEIELVNINQNREREHNYNIFVEEEDKKLQHHQDNHHQEVDHSHIQIVDSRTNEDVVIELLGQRGHEEFQFSECFIHQLIETIEFVLGTISNTASYLRLWALSLAHSQLSRVFFENTIGDGLKNASATQLVFTLPVWMSATLFVLMSMDVMECFLHTLRLHWVEFQNKFYKGQGYKFQPFSYSEIFTHKQ